MLVVAKKYADKHDVTVQYMTQYDIGAWWVVYIVIHPVAIMQITVVQMETQYATIVSDWWIEEHES